MTACRTVLCLGVSQLVCWGITYFMIGVFGQSIAADLGWSRVLVYGGFTAALAVMGASSPLTGRLIDRYGGRRVMASGSALAALACAGVAAAHGVAMYYAAWICMGAAMRLTLYDAAFAALARIRGPEAMRSISLVTLVGGFASTLFWPIGHALAAHFGWRGALCAYAVFALLTIPLHLSIPDTRYAHEREPHVEARSRAPAPSGRRRSLAAVLYATITALTNFLNSAMSAHMIAILSGFGLAASVAVWVSTFRGIGQSTARLCEVLFGARLHPVTLNLLAAIVLPVSFAAGLLSAQFITAAIAFAFLYGAGNGIATITRGTLPLVLFDYRTYGALTGRLLMPSFALAALAPIAYAFVIQRFGQTDALVLSIAVGLCVLITAAALKWLVRTSGADPAGERA